ncbi:MAG TPA: DUF1549 and DUF1553 domain-containing protein [Gemmataceae bacterium]|nr:DUF1549 and DUF1553 domain-containing protein [Gemmataceae bacterium]
MRWSVPSLLLIGLCALPSSAADVADDWAFKPIAKPAVPPVRAGSNPIDVFLVAKLGEKGLRYAPEADKRTLLRRVYFDLIGLPPSPEEIDTFLKDTAPDAFEKVVDRLLASPQYGERMALFWLDLARFAETDGFKADDPRPNAWRYRDYVIKSFNTDKPYDRFVLEQLAGDELFPNDPDALVATGFLRHYPDEYNAVNLEQRRQEILNDITDTTGAAFLGITLGCAKCHDHKYDPLTQLDYYRFQAFFAGYWPVDAPMLSPAARQEFEAKLAAWEAKTAEVRAAIAKIEEPYHAKEIKKQRGRFPEEYQKVLDIPFEKRTPFERQIGAMIEKQVYTRGADVSKSLKPAEKEQWDALKAQFVDLSKEKPADPPRAMAMTDVGPEPPTTHLLKRGNWRFPGEEVVPGFLSAIDGRDAEVKPTASGTSGRRTALAKWISDPKNPLTSRVIVNRLWQQHFGKGIVASPGDFGATGERPTHPELLDWLATEFVAKNWSLKQLHRLIVTSTAYRQASRGDEAGLKIDPEDALLWHFPRRRLDGEALRDSMLAVSGQLNPKAGGPSVFPEIPAELKAAAKDWKVSADPAERNRRSVYVSVKRNLRYPMFSLFDSPDRTETCSRRFVTTTAPQALTLLNDPIVLAHSKAFADRVMKDAGTDPDQVIERAFVLALGRPPTTEERAAMKTFLANHKGPFPAAVTDLCHSLLNLNEFLYVD